MRAAGCNWEGRVPEGDGPIHITINLYDFGIISGRVSEGTASIIDVLVTGRGRFVLRLCSKNGDETMPSGIIDSYLERRRSCRTENNV